MENDTITIQIPAPPKGWVFEGIRKVKHGEQLYHAGRWEVWVATTQSTFKYPVAIPIPPKWTPPPEWAALFWHSWLAVDGNAGVFVYENKPSHSDDNEEAWVTNTGRFARVDHIVRPELLPPKDIPWNEACWEIGGDQ